MNSPLPTFTKKTTCAKTFSLVPAAVPRPMKLRKSTMFSLSDAGE